MKMKGVEGLNTVGMWTDDSQVFHVGDETIVDCIILWEEAFRNVISAGCMLSFGMEVSLRRAN